MLAALALAAALTQPTCGGLPIAKDWTFSEPAGSTTFHESLHRDPADDLTVQAGYQLPTASGAAAYFHNDSLLATRANVFDPEGRDWAVCIKYETTDTDSYNLWQIGNSHPVPSTYGMLKVTAWYGQLGASQQRFRVRTGLAPNGSGWHWQTWRRRGDVFSVWWDGHQVAASTVPGVGPIHLVNPMALGGKITPASHGLTTSHDLLNGGVADLQLAMRSAS